MKKYFEHIKVVLIGLLACITIVSCDDYLDVQPEDKLLESDVFTNELSLQSALNGIYSNMTSAELYGGNVTMSTLDVLAQRFDTYENSHPWHLHGTYKYTDTKVMGTFDNAWTKFYVNILNINNFVTGIEAYDSPLSLEKKNLLKGEAIGLRAMHHFDLLRIYGPIYSEFPEGLAIPYYTVAKAELTPVLPASKVMELIIKDLNDAEVLLENDPIKVYGKIAVLEEDAYELEDNDPLKPYKGADFYRYRHLRFNYFALKALQARVHLYAGNKPEALAAAKLVINEASEWFPWTDPTDVISAGANPDRIFSSEVLFSVQNIHLYDRFRGLFSSDLGSRDVLTAKEERLEEIFEANLNDYRFNSTWAKPPGKPNFDKKEFLKFKDVEDKDKEFRFMQPLIRMSEMHYIAAETETDPSIALAYLNTVRQNRGLVELEIEADMSEELLKEYQKEFYGEGQLFFYYKRNNMGSIPDGSTSTGIIEMNKSTYVVPLPLSEINFRND